MKAAVFSDTHANIALMLQAARESGADVFIHLGDHDRDAEALRREFPDKPLYVVAGNCDPGSRAPLAEVVPLGDVKIYICHGHQYGVDYGDVSRLVYAAQERGCRLALYGHTHRPDRQEIGGVQVLNPGTAGKGRQRSWALVEVFPNGGVACEIRYFDTI